jgi:DNA invertase Pin-like site-specific DNA recombinase
MIRSQKKPINRLIGYARVSTEVQSNDAQMIELRAAGCDTFYEDRGSGASRARPVLAKLLREIKAGDVLVVVRLDRLARSASHPLAVIEQLEQEGAHFLPARSDRYIHAKACFPCRFWALSRNWSAH